MEFLGVGLQFPANETNSSNSFSLVSGIEKLKQSVAQIANTQRGTVFSNLDAGWERDELIFLANTPILEELIQLFLTEAIESQEPRVTVEDFVFSRPTENSLTAEIFLQTKDTNELFSFVYPFNLQ